MSFHLEDFDRHLWKISQNRDHHRLRLAIRLKFLGIMNPKSKRRIGSDLFNLKKDGRIFGILLKFTSRRNKCLYIDAVTYDSVPAGPVPHKKCCFESRLLPTQIVFFDVLVSSNRYDIVHNADVFVWPESRSICHLAFTLIMFNGHRRYFSGFQLG